MLFVNNSFNILKMDGSTNVHMLIIKNMWKNHWLIFEKM
jgi:hypothetical protein